MKKINIKFLFIALIIEVILGKNLIKKNSEI